MKTINFCIKLISDYINEKRTDDPRELIDWDKVIKFFKCHELSGVLYCQCESFMPSVYRNIINRQMAASVYSYSNRKWMEKNLRDRLVDAHIQFCIVKGLEIANYYPSPEIRTMGDTDLVVNTQERDIVNDILCSLGYKNIVKSDDKEWSYCYNDMQLELHDRLVYHEITNDSKSEYFFESFWKYVKNGMLDWNYHFIFLIFHIRKHFMNRGVGFRHFLDIAVITKNNTELDWNWIKQKLIELDMWEFAKRIFFLDYKWFGIKTPYNIDSYDKAFLYEATKMICHNGIFGFDNNENDVNYTIYGIKKRYKQNYGMRRMILFLFPGYKTLIKVDHYSFLKNRIYLLPAAWIYRALRIIRSKKVYSILNNKIKTSFVSRKRVEEREVVLRSWGLDNTDN